MIKRTLDIILASFALIVFLPIIMAAAVAIWLEDKQNPFYLSERVGKDLKPFIMYKLRTMRKSNHDLSHITSIYGNDRINRITRIGKLLRRFKIDEFPQLFNVVLGNMTIVAPRPRMAAEIKDYHDDELKIFSVRPGLTDIATILFSLEERNILINCDDPVLVYHQLLRPWKALLCLYYIENQSLWLDIRIIFITGIVIVKRKVALKLLSNMMEKIGAPAEVVEVIRKGKNVSSIPLPDKLKIITKQSVQNSDRHDQKIGKIIA